MIVSLPNRELTCHQQRDTVDVLVALSTIVFMSYPFSRSVVLAIALPAVTLEDVVESVPLSWT